MNWKKLVKATNFIVVTLVAYVALGAVICALSIWNPIITTIVVSGGAFVFLVWIVYKTL